MVEYLLHNLKVEGWCPACAQIYVKPLENSGGAENSAEISGTNGKKVFAPCTNLVCNIRSGYQKLTSRLVTVYGWGGGGVIIPYSPPPKQ